MGPTDRRYIDDQILGCEQHLVDSLINGNLATWYDLDGASANVTAGHTVCLASVAAGTVTKSTAAKLALGGIVLGVVLRAAAAGGKVLVALHGSILPPTTTGLATGAPGYVRVNTSTGGLERVTTIASTDFVVGTVDNVGYMFVAPQITAVTSSSSTTTEADVVLTPLLTTDATVTTIYSFTIPTQSVAYLAAKLKFKKTSDPTVTAAFAVEAYWDNNAGSVTQHIASPVTTLYNSSTFVVTLLTGSTAGIRVAGVAATQGTWTGRAYVSIH